MSRLIKNSGNKELTYGRDHLLGLFVQVFESGQQDPIVDLSSEVDKITVKDIVEIASEHGFDLSDELNEDTIL